MSECVFVCVCVWCSSAGSSGSHHRSSRGGKRGAFTQPRRGNKRGKAAAAGRWCVGGWNWRRPEKGENHPACRGKWKKKPVCSYSILLKPYYNLQYTATATIFREEFSMRSIPATDLSPQCELPTLSVQPVIFMVRHTWSMVHMSRSLFGFVDIFCILPEDNRRNNFADLRNKKNLFLFCI